MAILLIMPFHAFLTVWAASIFGHYTALRLWKEVLLLFSGIGVIYLLFIDHKIRLHTLSRRLVWMILAYILLNITWGLLALNQHDVSAKALGYGLIVNLRFLIFFMITWAIALRMSRLRIHWQWMVLWPAAIVIVFGLLQVLVLPRDFLVHFGYGPDTIPPFETINHNSHYIRIASTLRGVNPLGAYLLIPISLLTILILRGRRQRLYGGLLVAGLMVEIFTFSRSAWVGTILTIGTILLVTLHAKKINPAYWIASGAILIVLIVTGIAVRNNPTFQNYFLHTETHSAIKSTSDTGHLTALKNSSKDALHHPLGNGPGTAGPASEYNNHPPRIAENYYLQIAQETGWLGLILFSLITITVGYLLWLRRDHPLALSLFASLVGISFIGLLLHVWTDDTIAYVWWGLAGIAMAPDLNKAE